jgi:hypothetical protein
MRRFAERNHTGVIPAALLTAICAMAGCSSDSPPLPDLTPQLKGPYRMGITGISSTTS